jgi:cyclopropane-fatty-acyl-phospholipid synthase
MRWEQEMHSRIYHGVVEHERFHPTAHRLSYRFYVYGLDLAELEVLDRRLPLFGYNRPRPASLYDRDYLDPRPGRLRGKLLARLEERGLAVDRIGQIVLVTSPRLLGRVFNPVSFFFCFDLSGRLVAVAAEVNNTYGEKHVYLLEGDGGGWPARFQAEKAFHVSPFNTMAGEYRFCFGDIRRELDVRIDLHREGRHILRAWLKGQGRELTRIQHLKTLVRHPIMPHLTLARIYREAFRLYFKRRLTFYDKPVPLSPMTLRRLPPTPLQRYCRKRILGHLAKAGIGRLVLTLPDGTARDFGPPSGRPPARMHVNDDRFFSRVALGADIGLGEAFMRDEWDTDDIAAVIAFFIRNREHFRDGNFTEALFMGMLERLRYLTRPNTLPGSRRNIRRHYDLSNAFFQTFLDESMAYSCAIFADQGESLAAAQQRKFETIMEKVQLSERDHLLEIGCGWGGFAIAAARRTGCRVTGTTISTDQYRLARERVREAGLEDRVRILFKDYRNLSGLFDKIVSIEMLEAVGHRYFGRFFRQLDRLLAPGGVALVQTIIIPDQRYASYRRSHDWIRKHIFPGGLLPCLTVLTRAMTRHSRLMVEAVENIGPHYAATLAAWHRRFTANREQVAALGFDREFQRKWAYYLKSCEAGFAERVLGDLQLVLVREGGGAGYEPWRQPEALSLGVLREV